jgi:hypothetical protein
MLLSGYDSKGKTELDELRKPMYGLYGTALIILEDRRTDAPYRYMLDMFLE